MYYISVIIILLLISSSDQNQTHLEDHETKSKSSHPTSAGWRHHYIFGVVGTILNSIVLYMLTDEKDSLVFEHEYQVDESRQLQVTSVNLLFWLETFSRVFHSLTFVPWKSYLMSSDSIDPTVKIKVQYI